jgi:hypothetical protein
MIPEEKQNQHQEDDESPPILTSEAKAALCFRHTKPSFPLDNAPGFLILTT